MEGQLFMDFMLCVMFEFQFIPGLPEDGSVHVPILGDPSASVHSRHHSYLPLLHGISHGRLLLSLVWPRNVDQAPPQITPTVSPHIFYKKKLYSGYLQGLKKS